MLVLTKENSFFVWIALVAVILTNRWLQFGTVTRELVIATVLGPLLGAVILVFLAGGLAELFHTYQLSVSKNLQLRYAILTGDGPWYRYLVDLLLVSPVILILAFGAVFRLNRAMKPELFMSIFIAASYLVMCNVKYGMNLRYANMWDMPLRFLALARSSRWSRRSSALSEHRSRCRRRLDLCNRASPVLHSRGAVSALRTNHRTPRARASDFEVAVKSRNTSHE